MKTHKGFMNEVEITQEDFASFRRLAANADFLNFVAVVEELLQGYAYTLLSERDENAKADLSHFRGGYAFWKKILLLVTGTDGVLEELNKSNEPTN